MSLYENFVPMFVQIVDAQLGLIDKAEAYCAANGVAPETLLEARLSADMLPLKFQLRQVGFHSAGAMGRLTGATAPTFDGETFAALREELKAGLAYLKAIKPDDLAGFESKPVVFETRVGKLNFENGRDYLARFALPNFMFHAATGYGILRKAGAEIGKRDFMGNVPMTRS